MPGDAFASESRGQSATRADEETLGQALVGKEAPPARPDIGVGLDRQRKPVNVDRWDKLLLCPALIALFGIAAWFRASSLSTSPGPFADEACSGIQGAHLIQGKP